VLFVKVFAGVFAFPICAILITQSSPSRELLGTVNGANQALGSLCRALGPALAGVMYTRSLEVSKPYIVWRYGLGIFAIIVWIGGWFLTDDVRLPSAKGYAVVEDRDDDDVIEEEIEEEEDRLWREEEDGTIDLERAFPSVKERGKRPAEADDLDGSSDEEMVEGVSKHFLASDQ
jgi:MFS family permease